MSALQSEAPPSYREVIEDAPPSYNQLFGVGQMKQEVMQAHEESPNKGVFALKFCNIFCGSVACLICSIILAALPLTMVIIGSIYLHRCPVNGHIPIWMIVFGVLSLVQTMINIAKRCCSCKKNEDEDQGQDYGRRSGNCFESLLTTFLFVWVIIGSIWVFRFFNSFIENDCINNADEDSCCHPVPYLFSFVTLVAMYSISVLILVCCFCCFLCFALKRVD